MVWWTRVRIEEGIKAGEDGGKPGGEELGSANSAYDKRQA
jgi:hypothetical protein